MTIGESGNSQFLVGASNIIGTTYSSNTENRLGSIRGPRSGCNDGHRMRPKTSAEAPSELFLVCPIICPSGIVPVALPTIESLPGCLRHSLHKSILRVPCLAACTEPSAPKRDSQHRPGCRRARSMDLQTAYRNASTSLSASHLLSWIHPEGFLCLCAGKPVV